MFWNCDAVLKLHTVDDFCEIMSQHKNAGMFFVNSDSFLLTHFLTCGETEVSGRFPHLLILKCGFVTAVVLTWVQHWSVVVCCSTLATFLPCTLYSVYSAVCKISRVVRRKCRVLRDISRYVSTACWTTLWYNISTRRPVKTSGRARTTNADIGL